MRCFTQVIPYHGEDHRISGFIPAWVPTYGRQERKAKPEDSQQKVLTPGKRSCWGGTAMTGSRVLLATAVGEQSLLGA